MIIIDQNEFFGSGFDESITCQVLVKYMKKKKSHCTIFQVIFDCFILFFIELPWGKFSEIHQNNKFLINNNEIYL